MLDANPLANIRNTNTVRNVMKNDRLYQADSMSEIWPRKKARLAPWWMQSDAEAPDRSRN